MKEQRGAVRDVQQDDVFARRCLDADRLAGGAARTQSNGGFDLPHAGGGLRPRERRLTGNDERDGFRFLGHELALSSWAGAALSSSHIESSETDVVHADSTTVHWTA